MSTLSSIALPRGAVTRTAEAPRLIQRSIRHYAAKTLHKHSDGVPGHFDSSAAPTFHSLVESLKALHDAKVAHEESVKEIDSILTALDGHAPAYDSPIVRHVQTLVADAKVVRSVDPTLAAANLDELRDMFREAKDLLADIGNALDNQHTKNVRYTKQAAGAVLADIKNLGTVLDGIELKDVLPAHWLRDIEPLPGPLGNATMNPTEKLDSPNRTASVLHWQLNACRDKDRAAKDKREKAAAVEKRKEEERATLAELKGLINE